METSIDITWINPAYILLYFSVKAYKFCFINEVIIQMLTQQVEFFFFMISVVNIIREPLCRSGKTQKQSVLIQIIANKLHTEQHKNSAKHDNEL